MAGVVANCGSSEVKIGEIGQSGNVGAFAPVLPLVTTPSPDPARRRRATRRAAVVATVFTAVAAGCGSGAPTAAPSEGTTAAVTSTSSATAPSTATTVSSSDDTAAPTSVAPETVFADVDVVDVYTGEPLNLKAQLSGGDTPVLLWFWAPH